MKSIAETIKSIAETTCTIKGLVHVNHVTSVKVSAERGVTPRSEAEGRVTPNGALSFFVTGSRVDGSNVVRSC